jgi:hypothetical protein
MVAPWTRTLTARWRPQLRFYEERIPILRAFEDEGVLRGFAVAEDSIGARVLEPEHQITVRQDGLSVDLFGQDPDLATVRQLISLTLEKIAPAGLRAPTARFSHIVPLAVPFQEAVQRSIAPIVPSTPSNVSGVDFALLLDLATPDETAQIEYGIIRSSEARRRLRGISHRIVPVSQAIRDRDWETVKFPEVSLFADSMWQQDVKVGLQEAQDVWGFWERATRYAGEFVDGLASRMIDEEKGRDIA